MIILLKFKNYGGNIMILKKIDIIILNVKNSSNKILNKRKPKGGGGG